MPNIKQSVTVFQADENGVIKNETRNETISYGIEPNYIKLYLQDILYLSDMPGRYTDLLMALLKRVSYAGDEDGLCVVLVPRVKKNICQELGWKGVQSLENALGALKKGKIIYHIDRGVYRLNPYLFGKGEWQDIARLRMEITYDIKGRTFRTAVERSDAIDTQAAQEAEEPEAKAV